MKFCVETCSLGYVAIATNYADGLFWVSINSESPKLFDEFFTALPHLLNKTFTPPDPETVDKVLSIIASRALSEIKVNQILIRW